MEIVKCFRAAGAEWELRFDTDSAAGMVRHRTTEFTVRGVRQIYGIIAIRVEIRGDVFAEPLPIMVDADSGSPIDFAALIKPWNDLWNRNGGSR